MCSYRGGQKLEEDGEVVEAGGGGRGEGGEEAWPRKFVDYARSLSSARNASRGLVPILEFQSFVLELCCVAV